MIFNGFKRRWMRKELQKNKPVNTTGIQWPKSLMVIANNATVDDVKVFHSWAKKLKIDHNKLVVISKVTDIDKQDTDLAYFIDDRSIKWSGGFKSPDIKNILEQSVDLQIVTFEPGDEILDFVAHRNKANFKVSLGQEEKEYDNLTIKIDPVDHSLFIAELQKYLHILCKN